MPKKRRTRKEKIIRAQQEIRQFDTPTYSFVKREFAGSQAQSSSNLQNHKKQEFLGQIELLASVKQDLVKTFILASAILAIEAVLYFAWK